METERQLPEYQLLQVLKKDTENKFDHQHEIDQRSVFVGNIDYATTPVELAEYFSQSGSVHRVTIQCSKYTGSPKGYAYVEFDDEKSIEPTLKLNGKEFKGRPLVVSRKRTNVPGFAKPRVYTKKQHRPNKKDGSNY